MSYDATLPSWAVRGAKVVCIEPNNWAETRAVVEDPYELIQYPQHGETSTIREVNVRFVPEYMEVIIGVLLREVVNIPADGGSAAGHEMAWDIRGFAPVVAAKHERRADVGDGQLSGTNRSYEDMLP